MSRKQRLMKAALDLFQSSGIRNASIAKITEAAGMSKGSFYQHFDSKEALVLAVLDLYYETLFASPEEKKNGRALLQARLKWEIDHALAHRTFIFELMSTYPPGGDHGITEAFQAHHAQVLTWRQSALLAAFGSSIESQLEDLSMLTDGILHSYLQQMLWHNRAYSPHDISEFIVSAAEALAGLDRPSLSTEKVTMEELHESCGRALTLCREKRTRELLNEILGQFQDGDPVWIVVDTLLEKAASLEKHSGIRELELQWVRWKGVQADD